MAWWLFFLMALPFGVHPDPEPQQGNVESAPAKPRLWLKAAVATVLAGLATWGVACGRLAITDSGAPPTLTASDGTATGATAALLPALAATAAALPSASCGAPAAAAAAEPSTAPLSPNA